MSKSTDREISCRVTRTLLFYVREQNNGSLGDLLDGLDLNEEYLLDFNNWVSHEFLHVLYHRMFAILGDDNAVFKMALSAGRFESLGILDRVARLLGSPKLIYAQAPKYNKLLKLNGDVYIHQLGDTWVVLEDRYHRSDQKTRYDCDYTRGVLVGIPTIFGLQPAHVEEIECQVAPDTYGKRLWSDTPIHGARGCLYRVRWEKWKKISLAKRLFGRLAVYRRAIEDLQEVNRRIQEKYDEVRRLASDLETANKQLLESKKQLEANAANLLASEKRYRFLAENVTDIIWTLRLENLRFEYISPSIKGFGGFTAEEAMQLSLQQFLSTRSFEMATKILAEELEREKEHNQDPDRHRTMEVEQLCKDGSYAWAEVRVSFIRNEERQPVGLLGVTRDISERKRAEDQRKQLEAILVESQKMESIGTLAGGIAHNFNNILMAIQGYTSLMLLGMDAEHPHFEILTKIEESVKSAADLTKQILGFAQSGKYEVTTTDVNKLIDKSSEMFGRTRKEVRILRELQDEIWPVDVDRGQIEQVLLKLYINAWQAMPSGGNLYLGTENIILDERFVMPHGIPSGRYVKISVGDTGVGMDQNTLQRVFEPFFTTKEMGRGTGLGLAFVYGIIRNHGGIITASSEKSRGSTFVIYLPASPKEVVQRDEFDQDLLLGHETILFVDDEKMILGVVNKMLGALGYTVLTAGSGKEAIEIYSKEKDRIAIVILDIIMPDLGGLQVFEVLKSINPNVKVLLSSGYSLSGEATKILNQGYCGFLQKPFKLKDLSLKIREILRGDPHHLTVAPARDP